VRGIKFSGFTSLSKTKSRPSSWQIENWRAVSFECPDRPISAIEGHLEKISGAIRAIAGLKLAFSHHKSETGESAVFLHRRVFFAPDHALPKRKLHAFGIGVAEPRASLLIEQFPANFHEVFLFDCLRFGKLAGVAAAGI
jgi:hypothetical protein